MKKDFFSRLLRHLVFARNFAFQRIIYRFIPVKQNKVFIMTYDHDFTCNPSYIAKELLQRDKNIDIVFVCNNNNSSNFPEGVRTVVHRSPRMFIEMASSKVWIDNALTCVWDYMPKKKGQIYINTWHGSLGIKRLSGNKTWLMRAKRCNRFTDFCISNSIFEEDVYRSTFWKDVPYLRYGHPRNDLLFSCDKTYLRKKVSEFFCVPESTKFLLYAPTFRDDLSIDWLNLDYERLILTLHERFGGEWVILERLHFKNRNVNQSSANINVLNASLYPDMQELLSVVDIGITDYSSWAYDYVLQYKPLFIYAPDIEKYNDTRGFYYPLEATPFSIATDNDSLNKSIVEFESHKYAERVASFLAEKGCIEDGHAASRTANKIMEYLSY